MQVTLLKTTGLNNNNKKQLIKQLQTVKDKNRNLARKNKKIKFNTVQ